MRGDQQILLLSIMYRHGLGSHHSPQLPTLCSEALIFHHPSQSLFCQPSFLDRLLLFSSVRFAFRMSTKCQIF